MGPLMVQSKLFKLVQDTFLASVIQVMGSIDSPTRTQEDRVESDLRTLNVSTVHFVVAERPLAGYQASYPHSY
eukprot:1160800-Pelagomonas_calceolata.AAC.8